MASAQQGRNRMLFKVGKVSIITDTLPVFLHIMLDLLGFLYPFRPISAILVEIYDRQLLKSLPFSADFRYLGRDFQQAGSGISTFLYDFRCLGRDLRTAALGISTLFDRFPLFG